MISLIDIKENYIAPEVLSVLLKDRTTGKNIIWATDDYAAQGDGYSFFDQIRIELITGKNGMVIKPRTEKDKEAQIQRSKEKAEVFTPSWVCNMQNNLVDKAFLGCQFNTERQNSWEYEGKKIKFPRPNGKTWQDYVLANRLEVSCGEAPYLVSRYDTVTGKAIKVKSRIGLLDRKLRIISENVDNFTSWIAWAKKALKATYGFEWQGDNILLARENLLYTVEDFYFDKFKRHLPEKALYDCAEIISWNIWQMDGIKFVIPCSCHKETVTQMTLLGEETSVRECPGCNNGNRLAHNGAYAMVMDWEAKKAIRFVDLTREGI